MCRSVSRIISFLGIDQDHGRSPIGLKSNAEPTLTTPISRTEPTVPLTKSGRYKKSMIFSSELGNVYFQQDIFPPRSSKSMRIYQSSPRSGAENSMRGKHIKEPRHCFSQIVGLQAIMTPNQKRGSSPPTAPELKLEAALFKGRCPRPSISASFVIFLMSIGTPNHGFRNEAFFETL